MVREQLVQSFSRLALSPDPDLGVAALMMARVEYPNLDARPYLERLDRMGEEAAVRVNAAARLRVDTPQRVDADAYGRVMALNDYLFREQGFAGNDIHYEDPRNSYLNEVLDRRMGIPITLALVYLEVARRAGLAVEGVNFPGHFLVRCPVRRDARWGATPRSAQDEDMIIDVFHGGTLLSEPACRELLRRHAGEDAVWDRHLLGHATKTQILTRMLLNLKGVYVRMFSFPQARDITELLLAVDPSAVNELRDRGLLAYHLNDFSAALRDLQSYLKLSARSGMDQEDRAEHAQIWEHVKSLRRRVASLN
jgi:regulator of sirC expression with transglutaminase-like and TPR domain